MTYETSLRASVGAALEARCQPGGDLSVDSPRSTSNMYDASPVRLRVWKDVFEQLLAQADVPREGKAIIITAGPPGAGKSTQLEAAMSDGALSGWRRLDSDVIKDHLIRQALSDRVYEDLLRVSLPDGRPIMPLELSGLVHMESVQMLDDLTQVCMSRGENVILEGTLSWPSQVDRHIHEIAEHGYDALDIVAVDVSIEVARERALQRWWQARTDPNADLGGRFVPRSAIDACYSPSGRSLCRANAEELRRRARRLDGLRVRFLEPGDIPGHHLRAVGDE